MPISCLFLPIYCLFKPLVAVSAAVFMLSQPLYADSAAYLLLVPPQIADSVAFLLHLLPLVAESAAFLVLMPPHVPRIFLIFCYSLLILKPSAAYAVFDCRFCHLFVAYAAFSFLIPTSTSFSSYCRALFAGMLLPHGGAGRSSRSAGSIKM